MTNERNLFINARADGSVTVVIQKLVVSMPDSRSVLVPIVMFFNVVVVLAVVVVVVAVVVVGMFFVVVVVIFSCYRFYYLRKKINCETFYEILHN